MLKHTILALIAAVTIQASATNTVTNIPANTITIRAVVCGEDVVKVCRNRLWFYHIVGDYPSNIKVNNRSWIPEWNKGSSEDFVMVDPPRFMPMRMYGKSRVFVTSSTPTTNALVKVVEKPDEFNGWTLLVSLKNLKQEPVWVDATISWEIDRTAIIHPRSIVECTKPSPTPVGLR